MNNLLYQIKGKAHEPYIQGQLWKCAQMKSALNEGTKSLVYIEKEILKK